MHCVIESGPDILRHSPFEPVHDAVGCINESTDVERSSQSLGTG
jgi:hypothetical protein